MITLKEAASNGFVRDTLNDLSISHVDAALEINYWAEKKLPVFSTTESSVRRWRRAKVGPDEAETATQVVSKLLGSSVKGTPSRPLEAVSGPPSMKILILDIEMSPNLVHTWKLRDVNIWPEHILEPTRMICFSAKWLGGPDRVEFYSEFHDGTKRMLDGIHRLLDEADVVMHYYGKAHDIPWINRELLLKGYLPPSPYKQIDLCQVVKRRFNFPSNSLATVTRELGIPSKESVGYSNWKGCMEGDPVCWNTMREYNVNDTVILEQLYHKLQPWIQSHPSFAAFRGTLSCPNCGSDKLERNGYSYTPASKFPRYVCNNCGKWSRDSKRISGTTVREIAE